MWCFNAASLRNLRARVRSRGLCVLRAKGVKGVLTVVYGCRYCLIAFRCHLFLIWMSFRWFLAATSRFRCDPASLGRSLPLALCAGLSVQWASIRHRHVPSTKERGGKASSAAPQQVILLIIAQSAVFPSHSPSWVTRTGPGIQWAFIRRRLVKEALCSRRLCGAGCLTGRVPPSSQMLSTYRTGPGLRSIAFLLDGGTILQGTSVCRRDSKSRTRRCVSRGLTLFNFDRLAAEPPVEIRP
ncbi:hypothetical protein NDU88_001094 [Pleurodeles waltl]|uniref:Uncharacterized protein n=1 Tax=Pleurodeles waltl TaxID=8319 RepID=A0AAV7S969_PLEWA|nr:hypothetical protein NDU88_001094 [Pleurodeles waltl]